MQEADPKARKRPFLMINGALMTEAEFVNRMHAISDEIFRNTKNDHKPYLFGYPPTVEIKTYDD